MMKTAKVMPTVEATLDATTEETVMYSLPFNKDKVSIDWDTDGNPVLVFTAPAKNVELPAKLAESTVDWAYSIGVPVNDLLGALYDAANTSIAFNALKQMVLK